MITIGVLLFTNAITLFLLTDPFTTGIFGSRDNKTVAVVGNVEIDRQALRNTLEERYGEMVLRDLVDEEVVVQTAERLDLSVSESELEREMLFIKTKYGSYDQKYLSSKDEWESEVENKILLEKILAKDVKIAEEDIKAYYEENKSQFEIPSAYHLSHIVVDKKKAAEKIHAELKDGASFIALAVEQSTDTVTSTMEGDIGYITKKSSRYPKSYAKKAKDLEEGTFSKPFKVDDGYAIIYLHETIKADTFSYKEVKSMIERQLAVSQMSGAVTADYFWEDSGVEWKYQ